MPCPELYHPRVVKTGRSWWWPARSKTPSYSLCFSFPASSAEAERQTQTLQDPEVFQAIIAGRACCVVFFRTLARAAVQHEPDFVPATRPVAGEMQRQRGEVRFALPRARGWRLGSGQGERWRPPPGLSGLRQGVQPESPERDLPGTWLSLTKWGLRRREGKYVRNGTLTCIKLIEKRISKRYRGLYSPLLLTDKNSCSEN